MTRIRITTFLLAAAVLLTLAATASASDSSLLYSVTSKDLQISGSGRAMRVSVPASAPLSWFTNRPARKAGSSTAAALVNGWQANGFTTDPPNAAVVTSGATGSMQTIVTLRDPRQANGRISFRYTVIGQGSMLGMRTTGRPAPGRYRGELFVDSATISPCSTGTTYVGERLAQCYTTAWYADYIFLNNAADGTQLTYACGAGLKVRHFAPRPDITYALQPCGAQTQVGWATRNSTYNSVGYGQNSYLSVPPGVTFTFSFDPPCGLTVNPASGMSTCIVPAGTSVSIDRPTDGNTRINACGLNGATTFTYDSTASGVRNYSAIAGACDNYTAIADVPTTIATVTIHAVDDTKLLLNAG